MSILKIRDEDGKIIEIPILKGDKGDTGASGSNGKDGTSVTVKSVSESTADGGSNVVTFSDGKTLTVKNGSKGSKGVDGYTPKKGVDYYTEEDKAEFSQYIASELAKRGQLKPEYANSIEECTDTSKIYVLPDGYIYLYKKSTVEQTETIIDVIENTDGNPYYENHRLGSSATSTTDGFTSGATGYHITPLIDLTKYRGKKIQLHLEGANYVNASAATYITHRAYAPDGSVAYVRGNTTTEANYLGAWSTAEVIINSTTSATIEIDTPLLYGSGNVEIGYLRFCGKGAVADSHISISYQEPTTVTEEQWTNTGIQFVASGIDDETLAKISTLNNEGTSPSTVKLLPKSVLDFYNASAYSDSDYTKSHLSRITYPCRADIPVPFTVKWEYNENAMRTTVAVDTKTIGTANAHTMLTYDVTGLNKYPLYNLLPNTRYYYKVTHIMADGSIIEAKSGNFVTSNESIRLIYIDGTQNVRDLGGWSGLNGKKVKYGKIFRGATFSDTSYSELVLTGKGKRSLGELKVQAELNLGAVDTETSISASCSYHKIGYSSYATAITDANARANFKIALEKIVSWLSESTPRNIYMHCQGGCDRTGTLSFQLLGLLGVSESDLAKEYELSSFSSIGIGRLRTTTKAVDVYDYVGMVEALKTYSGTTITDKFYNFAIACGVSADTIASFRSLMLE